MCTLTRMGNGCNTPIEFLLNKKAQVMQLYGISESIAPCDHVIYTHLTEYINLGIKLSDQCLTGITML